MDQRSEFSEALAALVEFANVNGNIVTKKDVHDFFKDILPTEDMYASVYQYLSESKINIEGYTPTVTAAPTEDSNEAEFKPEKKEETEEGNMFLQMYLDDLSSIDKIGKETLTNLAKDAINKDKEAINALVETHLQMVIDISKDCADSGMKMTDIISEGNIALMEAVLDMSTVPDNISEYLSQRVRNHILQTIESEISILRTSNHITERANKISDATSYLAGKLGREATIEELCEYLSLPEEKVRDIIKMSLDAINVINDK